MKASMVSLVFVFGLYQATGLAYQPNRPEKYEDLPKSKAQKKVEMQIFLPVCMDEVRVAWIDTALMRFDFPFLRDMNDQEIRDWVVKKFSYISEVQTRMDDLRNTSIPVDSRRESQIRAVPKGYGRASVYSLQEEGGKPLLIDLKGSGLTSERKLKRNLKLAKELSIEEIIDVGHSDGLMSLGEAIAEVSRQRIVQRLFEDFNRKRNYEIGLQTSEIYFIMTLPFSIKRSSGNLPASVIGRQTSFYRKNYYLDFLDYDTELLVMQDIYMDKGGFLQHDGLGAALDFGSVEVRGAEFLKRFGMDDESQRFDAQSSKVWRFAHETASAFNDENSDVVYKHLETMLEPKKAIIYDDWKKARDFWLTDDGVKVWSWMVRRSLFVFHYVNDDWDDYQDELSSLVDKLRSRVESFYADDENKSKLLLDDLEKTFNELASE